MKVDAHQLWQACKNASLYAKEKTWNGGEAKVSIDRRYVTITASDDFVTVWTTAPFESDSASDDRGVYYLTAKELKALEACLRGIDPEDKQKKAVPLEGSVDLFDLLKEKRPGPGPLTELEWWAGLRHVQRSLDKPVSAGAWELNPERLTLLSRLEPKGEYPLSWQAFELQESWLWAFRYGPRCRGLVVPLDREELNLEDAEEALW